MRIILIISLFFLSCKGTKIIVVVPTAIDSTQAYLGWTTNKETGIVNYQVEQSPDSINNWVVLTTVLPKYLTVNNYTYALPLPIKYYKVKANTKPPGKPYYTKSILRKGAASIVNITNARVRQGLIIDALSWNTKNEAQVSYYLIERSSANVFSTVSKINAKGDSKYALSIWNGNAHYVYRNTPYYKDGSKGVVVNFQ